MSKWTGPSSPLSFRTLSSGTTSRTPQKPCFCCSAFASRQTLRFVCSRLRSKLLDCKVFFSLPSSVCSPSSFKPDSSPLSTLFPWISLPRPASPRLLAALTFFPDLPPLACFSQTPRHSHALPLDSRSSRPASPKLLAALTLFPWISDRVLGFFPKPLNPCVAAIFSRGILVPPSNEGFLFVQPSTLGASRLQELAPSTCKISSLYQWQHQIDQVLYGAHLPKSLQVQPLIPHNF